MPRIASDCALLRFSPYCGAGTRRWRSRWRGTCTPSAPSCWPSRARSGPATRPARCHSCLTAPYLALFHLIAPYCSIGPKLLACKGQLRPGHRPAAAALLRLFRPSAPYCPELPAFQGKALELPAFEGKALKGKALKGKALKGKAFQGKALKGKAFQGKAFQGKALELPAFRASPARQTPQHSSVGGQRPR